MSVRILVVDDHEPFRLYLAGLLDRQPGLKVVGDAADAQAAIALLDTLRAEDSPDVMLVDVDMPGCDGIELTRQVLAARPGIRVVALSMHDDPPIVEAMLAAGALAYALKSDPLADLVRSIRDAAAGRSSRGHSTSG